MNTWHDCRIAVESIRVDFEGVADGALTLIDRLEQTGFPLPTGICGTVDQTISFEWHRIYGHSSFLSFDVIDSEIAEVFLMQKWTENILKEVRIQSIDWTDYTGLS